MDGAAGAPIPENEPPHENGNADPFPVDYGDGPHAAVENDPTILPPGQKPVILMIGLPRSGKTAIRKTIFHNGNPHEMVFMASTPEVVKDDICNSRFVQYELWDIPGRVDFHDLSFDWDSVLDKCDSIIYVIDIRAKWNESLDYFRNITIKAHETKPEIKFNMFIHKADDMPEEHKMDSERDIIQRTRDNFKDFGLEEIMMSFRLTSIYDHSVYEAFSKVVQRLTPQLNILENLLDIFIRNSKIDQAFLVDVKSKIHIASDTGLADLQCSNLAYEMIDIVLDLTCVYGQKASDFDKDLASFIKLNSGICLSMKEVHKHLVLLCILKEESEGNLGILEYNANCFREAIKVVFQIRSTQAVRRYGPRILRTAANGGYNTAFLRNGASTANGAARVNGNGAGGPGIQNGFSNGPAHE